jgi:hypothetical protein
MSLLNPVLVNSRVIYFDRLVILKCAYTASKSLMVFSDGTTLQVSRDGELPAIISAIPTTFIKADDNLYVNDLFVKYVEVYWDAAESKEKVSLHLDESISSLASISSVLNVEKTGKFLTLSTLAATSSDAMVTESSAIADLAVAASTGTITSPDFALEFSQILNS